MNEWSLMSSDLGLTYYYYCIRDKYTDMNEWMEPDVLRCRADVLGTNTVKWRHTTEPEGHFVHIS